MRRINIFLLLAGFVTACTGTKDNTPLPILGERELVQGDTVYHRIPDFSFIDQDSQLVTNQTFAGKIYVVDFFFVSCPSICPKVAVQMKRLYDRFEKEERFLLLSHTVDPKHDTIPRLKEYARKLGVSAPKWRFVTGEEKELYDIADDYFSIVLKDDSAPGGYDHSGRFILVDEQRHIRAYCEGTDPESVDKFMGDIEKLLKEAGG